MEGAVVSVLFLSGVMSLTHITPDKTFLFISDKMDWPSARKYCTENFVDLASFADNTDLATLRGLVETEHQYAFVGLNREWQWIVLDEQDQREAEIKFNMFEDGEPRENTTCGMIRPSGNWTTDACKTKRPFICYDETISNRFVKGEGIEEFSDAKKYCRKHHTDLAKVRNEAENKQLVSLCNGTGAWIGLKKTLVWSDGTFTSFLPWSADKGDTHHCAALHITGEPLGIVTRDCTETLPFFCYTFARKKYTVRLTLSAAESAVDLGDSAADSVTKLLQSKLKEQGFSKGVHLTWRKRPQKEEPPTKPEELHCPMTANDL